MISHQSPRGEDQDYFTIIVKNERYDPQYFEEIVKKEFSFVSSVAVFGKQNGLICLVTLQVNEEREGRELATHVLTEAKKNGSGATNVVTARQCPRFKNFLQIKFQELNQLLVLQVQRISVLFQDFTTENGQIRADGTLDRTTIAHRHHNLIDPPFRTVMNPSGCTVDIPCLIISRECLESAIDKYQSWIDDKTQTKEAERFKVSTKRKHNKENMKGISHEVNRVPSSRSSSSSSARESPRNSQELPKPDLTSQNHQNPPPFDYKEWNPCKPDTKLNAALSNKAANPACEIPGGPKNPIQGQGQGRGQDRAPAEEARDDVLSPHTAAFCHFTPSTVEQDPTHPASVKRTKTYVCPPPIADPPDSARLSDGRLSAGAEEAPTKHVGGGDVAAETAASPPLPVSPFKENATSSHGAVDGGAAAAVAASSPPGAKPRKQQTPRALSPNQPLPAAESAKPAAGGADRGGGQSVPPRPRRRQGLPIASRPGAEVRLVQVCYAPSGWPGPPGDSDTELAAASSRGSARHWSIVFATEDDDELRRRPSAASAGSASSLENHSPSSSPFLAFCGRPPPPPPPTTSADGQRTPAADAPAAAGSVRVGSGRAGPSRLASEPRARVSWGGEQILGRESRPGSLEPAGGVHADHSPLWAKLMVPADFPPCPTPPPHPLRCAESPADAAVACGDPVGGQGADFGVQACAGAAGWPERERESGPASLTGGLRLAWCGGIAVVCRYIRQSMDFGGVRAPAGGAVASAAPTAETVHDLPHVDDDVVNGEGLRGAAGSALEAATVGPEASAIQAVLGEADCSLRKLCPHAPLLYSRAAVCDEGSMFSSSNSSGSRSSSSCCTSGCGGGGGGGASCFGNCFRAREAEQAQPVTGAGDRPRRPSIPRGLVVRPAGQRGDAAREMRAQEATLASPGERDPRSPRRSLLVCVFPGLGSACKRMRGGSRAEVDGR
jgi:hypothetical protein